MAKTCDLSGAAWIVIRGVAVVSVGCTVTSPTHGAAPVEGALTMMRTWTWSLAAGSAVGVPALAAVHSDHLLPTHDRTSTSADEPSGVPEV